MLQLRHNITHTHTHIDVSHLYPFLYHCLSIWSESLISSIYRYFFLSFKVPCDFCYLLHVCVHTQLCVILCDPMELQPANTTGDLPDPGIKPMFHESPALTGRYFTTKPCGNLCGKPCGKSHITYKQYMYFACMCVCVCVVEYYSVTSNHLVLSFTTR